MNFDVDVDFGRPTLPTLLLAGTVDGLFLMSSMEGVASWRSEGWGERKLLDVMTEGGANASSVLDAVGEVRMNDGDGLGLDLEMRNGLEDGFTASALTVDCECCSIRSRGCLESVLGLLPEYTYLLRIVLTLSLVESVANSCFLTLSEKC